MAHCPPEKIADLAAELAVMRAWPKMVEKSLGIFYLKSTPFLHFHVTKEGARWADVREGAVWGPQLDIRPGASAKERKAWLASVATRYESVMGEKPV
ncbi:MAG: hypothetical protein ABI743_06120 [bacterium]